MRIYIFGLLLALLIPLASCAQVVRAELGYQTTSRGIVWYRNGLPTKNPVWQLSRDTNKVMWCDTFTALRYDWDYKNDVWRTKGVSTSTLPPLPTQTSGSATIDNRTAFWRPANNILHRYDYNQTAWVPIGDWFYRSNAPSNVASGGGNGAAVYTTSLWQDSDDQIVRYWDGDSWEPFAAGSSVVVIDNVSEFATYPTTAGEELIVWRDADRGGVFVDKTTGSANGGTIFSGTGSTKWHRLTPDGRLNTKWWGCKGDGSTDDTNAMQAAANYAGNNNAHLYFPAGTYITSGTVTIDSFSTVVVSGDGPNLSILKRKNSTVGTLNRVLRIDGNGNDQVTVMNIGFDGNSGGQAAPDSITQYQQYHSLYLLCTGDHAFKSITIQNVNSYNPLGDGISLAGSASGGFGLANLVNIYEENRIYTRSITVTANFDAVNITNFTGTVLEVEPNGFSGSYKYDMNLTNIYLNQELDLNLLGARAAGRKGTCNVHGLYLKGRINSMGEFDFNVDGFYLQTTAQLRMAYGSYRFSNGTIKADSTFSETALLTEAAANPTDFAQFKNVQFTKHSAVSSITSYFIDDNAAGANTRVIFEGCQFSDAVRSAGIRAGKFDFINCIHTLTDTTSACVYTNGSTTHSGVTSEVNIINNTLPDYAYLFRPSISGTGQKFRVTGGNARDGHNILWDRFDKIDVEALQQNQNWYYENTTTGLNASDFPKQGRWRIGDRLYYKAPAGKGAEWAECTVAGRADGTSATGATSGATFKKSGLHAVNTTGAVNGQVLRFNGSLWVPGNVDTSATNEAWTIDGDDSDTELITNQTVKFAGAGGATTDYDPGTNTLTITAPASGGNGIYGDGTAGSGDDNLPTGGSIVTTGGYPLSFNTNTSAGTVRTILNLSTPYSSDDAFTVWLKGKAPADSLKLYNFDAQEWIDALGGNLNLQSDQILQLNADSVKVSTVETKTKVSAIVGITPGGVLKKMVGSSTDDVIKWTTGGWIVGAQTGGGGGGGTVTSVGLALPSEFGVTGSPVTSSGTLTGAWANQTTNKVFAAPSGSTGTPTFRALVAADIPGQLLPSGTTSQTLRHDGSNWVANSIIRNDGTYIGISGAPVSGIELYVNGQFRSDGYIMSKGTGAVSTDASSHLRLYNTTASTGDIWKIGSLDDGTLSISSDNLGAVQASITPLGDLKLPNAINQTVDAAPPSAPSDGVATYTTELANVQTPTWIDENGQIWESMASEASAKWAKWSASGNGTAVSTWAINNSESGTPTTVNIASTNLFTSMRRLQYQTAASGSSVAGTRHNNLSFWRGNAAGLGGFYFECRFGFSVANTTNKQAFVGFRNSSSAIAGNTNPSSLTNMIGFGIDATQTTLRFFVNDGSGTATPTNLGANFPTNTNSSDMYEVRIFAAPNAGTVYYWAKNLSTGNTTSGSASSDLPSSTTFLCPHIWIGNGADATAVGIDIVQYSILTNY